MSAADGVAEHQELVGRIGGLLPHVDAAARLVIEAFGAGRRVYTFGNGGSATEASHLAEELVGRYRRDRRPLPAVSLSTDAAAITCIANDYSFDEVFERQVRGLVSTGDVVAGFTTSG